MLVTPKQKLKIKTIWRRKITRPVILIFILFLLISALSSYTGYIYLSANKALAECDRAFSQKQYIKAGRACEKSATLWHRDEAVEKADKANRIYKSNNYYFEGLKAFSNSEWEKALELLREVIKEDPNYPDAVEKIALAKESIEKGNSKKVAGATDDKSLSSIVYVPSPTAKKPSTPPKTSEETKAKLSHLEQKLEKLSTNSTPPQQNSLTLSLTKSEISANVLIWCLDKDFTDFLPYRGSGTIYNSNGYIYTNKHVVQQPDGSVPFTFCAVGVTDNISNPPDLKYWAFLYAYSPSTDVADLIILLDSGGNVLPQTTSFPYLKIGSSGILNPGDPVWIAGYPTIGLGTWTLTEGIISGRVGTDLKTDASITPGNSGGAALNKDKEFVGIPSAFAGVLGYIIGIDTVLSLNDWIFP